MPEKQQRAGTGRRLARPDYQGILEAKRSLLPYIKAREREDIFREDARIENQRQFEITRKLEEEKRQLAKKQGQIATGISGGQLAFDVYSGLEADKIAKGTDLVSSAVKGIGSGFKDTFTTGTGLDFGNIAKGLGSGIVGGVVGQKLLGDQMPDWLAGAVGGGAAGYAIGGIHTGLAGLIVGGGIGSLGLNI